jgi:hypothetical protein
MTYLLSIINDCAHGNNGNHGSHECKLDFKYIICTLLTCICLSLRLFRVNLDISRTACNIDVTPLLIRVSGIT